MLLEISAAGSHTDFRDGTPVYGQCRQIERATIVAKRIQESIGGSVAYEADVQRVTFTPSVRLEYGRAYTARLAGNVQDSQGQSLGSDTVWTFRIEPGPMAVFLPLASD